MNKKKIWGPETGGRITETTLILTISDAVVTYYLFSFYLHVWSSPTQRITLYHPLHYIFENLPWKFAAWIWIGYLPSLFAARSCRRILPWESRRRNLPWLFAVRICRKNLPWKFATDICRGFFVFFSKSFFVYVNKSCLYGS